MIVPSETSRARRLLAAVLALAGGATIAASAGRASAKAREDGAPAQALGMGDAVRATAVGSAGLFYNPAGIRLIRSYTFEGGYGFSGDRPGHAWSFGGVDSRTNPQVALGVLGTYIDSEDSGLARKGWRLRGGLATGTEWDGGSLQIGVGGHWLDLASSDDVGAREFLTVDAGIVLDLGGVVRLAAVGQNLLDTKALDEAPRTVALGVATVFDRIELAFDTELDVQSDPKEPVTSYAAGAQVLLGGTTVARAGFALDGHSGSRRVAAGLGWISTAAALDLGASKRLDGEADWLVSLGLRYFLP